VHGPNNTLPPVIHEIGPGSLAEHYGTPAIASTKHKHDPNLPTKHWWITEPMAEAIAVAEQLSTEPDRIFTPLQRPDADVARSHQMIDAFIAHVNATRAVTGLDEIPSGRVRPHMFRRHGNAHRPVRRLRDHPGYPAQTHRN
jgi:hypothetical protein